MPRRPQLWLLLSASWFAALACGDTVDVGCNNDQDCPQGKFCATNGRCANNTTIRPPNPVEDAGVVPRTDAGNEVIFDAGTATSTRPAGLVPSGNPEWTIILDGNTWILTEFSEFMRQADMGACYFIGYNLDRARSAGPVTSGADGPARGHSGWSQWYATGSYAFSPQCSSDYSAELNLGGVRYALMGTAVKSISRGATGMDGPSVTGTWSDGGRSGRFELYDYVR